MTKKKKLQVGDKVQVIGIDADTNYWGETFKKYIGKMGYVEHIAQDNVLTVSRLFANSPKLHLYVPGYCLKLIKAAKANTITTK